MDERHFEMEINGENVEKIIPRRNDIEEATVNDFKEIAFDGLMEKSIGKTIKELVAKAKNTEKKESELDIHISASDFGVSLSFKVKLNSST